MSNDARVVALFACAAMAALVAPERPVAACGPSFPTNLILRRADALATMWDGSFVEEAGKLVAVSARDRAALTRPPELMPAQAEEQARYDTAAARFHDDDLDGAARGFEALLRLPPAARRRLSVAAAYSLGRTWQARGEIAAAIAAYRQVRALAKAGFVDDAGLAISSLGQEARAERVGRGDLVAAVRRYAEQAAFEDHGGPVSLLTLVREASPKDRAALYRDDVGARLLALYFYSRRDEIDEAQRARWRRELDAQATTEARGAAYLAAAAYRDGEWDAAAGLAARCRHAPIATWVAAKLALRDGDRPRAEALLREVERAGLAGNAIDSDEPPYTLDADPRSLIRGELGLLALADQRFAEAADWFARGTRLEEAAYVAERVMSPDELLAVVRRAHEAPPRPTNDAGRRVAARDACEVWDVAVGEPPACWGARVLELYARRLLRAGRYDEALAAFTDTPPRGAAGEYVTSMKAADASAGLERAEQLFRAARTLRGHGMEITGTEVGPDWRMYDGDYERSMPCMPSPTTGYPRRVADPAAAAPPGDDRADAPVDPVEDTDDGSGCAAPPRADAALISPLEIARVTASGPTIDQRFAYRYEASRLAEAAANLTPPRSQAYAAALCWAARYAHRDQGRITALYDTYVRNGALGVGSRFGEACPEPDFHAARSFDADQRERQLARVLAAEHARAWTWPRLRAAAWRHRGWLALPALSLLVLALGWRLLRRRLRVAASRW